MSVIIATPFGVVLGVVVRDTKDTAAIRKVFEEEHGENVCISGV